MHAEYRWCCAQADADAGIRVIVVQGDPVGRAFCVGADAEALTGHVKRGTYDDGLRGEQQNPGYGVHPFLDAHFAWQLGMRVPMIANINGACAGVALALVAYCDIRFAADNAILTTAAPKLGLPAEYGLSWILPRLIARTRATDLLLSGRRFTGADAAAWGLVLDAVPSADLDERVTDYARMLADEVSPASLAMTKRQLAADLFRHDVGASIRESDALLQTAMRGPDFAEGVAALNERRPPRF